MTNIKINQTITPMEKMNETTIITSVENWMQKRNAAMFEIPCSDKKEAQGVQKLLKEKGYRPFIVTMGTELNVTLFLNDHYKN